jgi:nucleoside phosphorylase
MTAKIRRVSKVTRLCARPLDLKESTMPLVYVLASSKMEARPILAELRDGLTRRARRANILALGPNQVAVVVTGMGPERARMEAEAALGLVGHSDDGKPVTFHKPDAILVIGVCGGLTEAISEGQIVAYTECFSATRSLPIRCSSAFTAGLIETLRTHGIVCHPVIGVTSARIASARGEKLTLAREGAMVADMESYEILSAAERAGTPAAVLRVVLDSLSRSMPDFNRALNHRGELDQYKAFWIALASPLKTLRLIAATNRAIKRLAPAVRLVLESNCFRGGEGGWTE